MLKFNQGRRILNLRDKSEKVDGKSMGVKTQTDGAQNKITISSLNEVQNIFKQ